MRLFDPSYLKPKKMIPIVAISFTVLAASGYVQAVNSQAHVLAKKTLEEQATAAKTKPKATLLPWGFKIRHMGDDGDASLTYSVSSDTGSRTVSVSLVQTDGQWKVTELSPLQ